MNRRQFLMAAAALPALSLPDISNADITDYTDIWNDMLEWQRCRDDVMYFARNYIKVNHPDRLKKFEPTNVQLQMFDGIQKNSHYENLYARQTGKSLVGNIHAVHNAMFFQTNNVILHINIPTLAHNSYRILEMIARLPDFIKERNTIVKSKRHMVTFSSGSQINFDRYSDNLRGRQIDLSVNDEYMFRRYHPLADQTLRGSIARSERSISFSS